MPAFGGLVPSPERYGGAPPRVGTILQALNDARGTAYDVTPGSPVWVENMAMARALADVFDTNATLANQFDPRRMTALLERWEVICAVLVPPGATPTSRRATIAARLARLGTPVTFQYVSDLAASYLGPIGVSVIHNASSGSYLASWAGGWYVGGRNATSQRLSLVGNVSTAYQMLFVVTAAGQTGTAFFTWSPDNGTTTYGPIQMSPIGNALGSTGLTVTFPTASPLYAVGDVYTSYVNPAAGSSSLARITIACTKPTWMSYGDYYDRVGALRTVVDDALPAWVDFNITLDGVHGAGFYLDEANNLDNQRLT